MKARKNNDPTTQTFTSLTAAYEFFNRELFSAELPPCLITMQRHKGALGFFSGERFANTSDPKEITDEIALNPVHFATRKPVEVLSTLVHEMVHLWQHHFGERPRKGYHDRQWAGKMVEVGLIPTETGEMGGKQTGQHVTHLIEGKGVTPVLLRNCLKNTRRSFTTIGQGKMMKSARKRHRLLTSAAD